MDTAIAGRAQSTGKASQTGCPGRDIERRDLDLGLGRVGRQHQELLGGNNHWEEGGRRTLDRMIQEPRRSEEQEFDARSSYPQGGEEGTPPRDEGRRSSEWAKKTTVPEALGDTLVIEVVGREQRLEVPTRRNVAGRVTLVHLQTWVGKGRELEAQHQKALRR